MKLPDWLDDAPRWERREITDHYDPASETLTSDFLDSPLPLTDARRRRKDGEPLEYILGHCHIGSMTLKTDRRALVPRPETETLIRRFAERVDNLPPGPLVDCGTGTGFMAGWLSEQTDRTVVATDVNWAPLELARENRRLNQWGFTLVQMDGLRGLNSLAGVVANLPYVTRGDDRMTASVKRYEPNEALFPDGSPVEFYRQFIHRLESVLKPTGQAWLELTPELCRTLYQFTDSSTAWSQRRLENDLNENTRFLCLKRSS